MATCPICRVERSPGADVCGGCNAYRFPQVNPPVGSPPRLSGEAVAELRRRLADSTVLPSDQDSEPDPALIATPAPVTLAALQLAAATPRLVVVRGLRVSAEYRVCDGKNYVGRTADRPADIDLTGQEPPDQVWSSRQHAAITLDRGALVIEDLNSLNGTFVNRTRLHPGQKRELRPGDVITVGTVQLKVVV